MCIHIYIYLFIIKKRNTTHMYTYIYIYVPSYIQVFVYIYIFPKLALADGALTVLYKGPSRVCRIRASVWEHLSV